MILHPILAGAARCGARTTAVDQHDGDGQRDECQRCVEEQQNRKQGKQQDVHTRGYRPDAASGLALAVAPLCYNLRRLMSIPSRFTPYFTFLRGILERSRLSRTDMSTLLSRFRFGTDPSEDPFAGVRQPRWRPPGGRSDAVSVSEPEPEKSTRAVGR